MGVLVSSDPLLSGDQRAVNSSQRWAAAAHPCDRDACVAREGRVGSRGRLRGNQVRAEQAAVGLHVAPLAPALGSLLGGSWSHCFGEDSRVLSMWLLSSRRSERPLQGPESAPSLPVCGQSCWTRHGWGGVSGVTGTRMGWGQPWTPLPCGLLGALSGWAAAGEAACRPGAGPQRPWATPACLRTSASFTFRFSPSVRPIRRP